MYYEINVSENGKHLFATAPRSITTREKLIRMVQIFAKEFTAKAGFKMSVKYVQETGKAIDISGLLNERTNAEREAEMEFILSHPNWDH